MNLNNVIKISKREQFTFMKPNQKVNFKVKVPIEIFVGYKEAHPNATGLVRNPLNPLTIYEEDERLFEREWEFYDQFMPELGGCYSKSTPRLISKNDKKYSKYKAIWDANKIENKLGLKQNELKN